MRKMGILNKLNYQAGLLNDGASAEEAVIAPEEQIEIIANGAETVVPEEINEAEVLLNEIVTEDEIIEEELAEVTEEQEVVAEGLQSDFTAVTTRNMIKSIERINARYGENSILTAGMQSDRFGGHKDLYVAGLQAKENFFKNAAKNVMALIQSFIDKIKELAKKVMIWLNNDEKTAIALVSALKSKKATLKEGVESKLDEKEKNAVAAKFGAYLAIDLKLKEYPVVMSKILGEEVIIDVAHLDKTPIGSSRQTLDKQIKTLDAVSKEYAEAYGISVVGKSIKLLANDNGKLSVSTVTVADADYEDALPTEVPSLEILQSFAAGAVKLASSLKTYANNSWKSVEEFKRYIKDQSAEDESFASKKSAAIAANQIAMANLSFYTASQKSMIWFAGAFANKYEGTDVKKPAEEKK